MTKGQLINYLEYNGWVLLKDTDNVYIDPKTKDKYTLKSDYVFVEYLANNGYITAGSYRYKKMYLFKNELHLI